MKLIRARYILCLMLCFILRMAQASPTDNYRFWAEVEHKTVVGSGGETSLGELHDLIFARDGTMYGVAKQNGLVVFDPTKKHWLLVDGDKPAIHGNIKVGLRAMPLKSSGSRKLIVLDPERLDRMTGYAEQIAVDPNGRLWVVTHDSTIYRQDGAFWQRMPGLAKSIEIGRDGSVFAMQSEPVRPRRVGGKQMRPAPKTRQIVKWNGNGWNVVGSNDRGSITALAVSAAGVPWIAHDCTIDAPNSHGQCIARWEGGWVNVPIDKLKWAHHIAFDEEGVLWADISQFESDSVLLRSYVTRRDGIWQHEFNSLSAISGTALAVRNGNPALGTATAGVVHPVRINGWLVYPSQGISKIALAPAGVVWVGKSVRNYTNTQFQSHRWLGGNTWSAPVRGEPIAFDSDGAWVDSSLNLTESQDRGKFSLIVRSHDETYFAVPAATPTQLKKRLGGQQVVYKIENGRSTALGEPLGTIDHLAVDAQGRPWIYGQKEITGTHVAPAIYRFEDDIWVPVPAPADYEWSYNLRSGLDGSVVMTGREKIVGLGSPVAIWKDENWVVLKAPADISLLEAITDKDGFVWGTARGGRMVVQVGASIAVNTHTSTKNPQIEETVPSPSVSTVGELGLAVEVIEVNETPVKVPVKSLAETKTVQPVAVFDDDFVGCWAWSNGAMIIVKKNGYANNGFAPGPWQAQGNQQYRIEWPDLVSSVSLIAAGTKMIEKNLFGESGGQRVSGATTGFGGSWLLDNGATAHADADGNYTIGPLRGNWRSESGSNRFEIAWPIVDKITLATDGASLSGANQFGRFTATKRASCK